MVQDLKREEEFNNFKFKTLNLKLNKMARFRGPKKKRSKKLGLNSAVIQTNRKLSDYGIRLREKQKAKFIYGVLESQFKRYFVSSAKNPKNTALILMQTLERRLDNVLHRLGFAKSRAHSRQLISHGHVLVDDKRVKTPSFLVSLGQKISVDKKVADNIFVLESLKEKEAESLPSWLTRDGAIGKIMRLPERGEMEQDIDENLIIEYYSR